MENPFNSILNEQLSSVEFVQDYVQLRFDGNCLTCYVWPLIKFKALCYKYGQVGFREALCGIITHKVKDVVLVNDNYLEVLFDNETKLNFSLIRDKANETLPEFVYFTDVDNGWFVLD